MNKLLNFFEFFTLLKILGHRLGFFASKKVCLINLKTLSAGYQIEALLKVPSSDFQLLKYLFVNYSLHLLSRRANKKIDNLKSRVLNYIFSSQKESIKIGWKVEIFFQFMKTLHEVEKVVFRDIFYTCIHGHAWTRWNFVN